jgi:ATP-binding cassette subfamily F protein 3
VKLLSSRLAPMSGRITRADRMEIAYFAQHQVDELDLDASAYDHLRRLMPDAPESKVRARAGAIGFSEAAADTPAANLSGGEKARLLLGLATLKGPHLVILDEPTNHLDIDSRSALIEAINDHAGAVILVSHDRYLLEACADRLWLVADGHVTPFEGDLDDYRRLVLSDRSPQGGGRKAARGAGAGRADIRRAAAQMRIETAPLRRRIADAETAVQRLTDEIARIDAALADAGLFTRDPAKAAALAKARAAAVSALADAESEWFAASAALEAATT